MNSGMASYEAASGKYAPVYFHLWVRGAGYRMSDILGATVDSRIIAFETKHSDWTLKPLNRKSETSVREHEQAAFLACVRKAGGIAAFITDPEKVHALLAI